MIECQLQMSSPQVNSSGSAGSGRPVWGEVVPAALRPLLGSDTGPVRFLEPCDSLLTLGTLGLGPVSSSTPRRQEVLRAGPRPSYRTSFLSQQQAHPNLRESFRPRENFWVCVGVAASPVLQ